MAENISALIPHDRTGLQSAVIYSDSSTTFTRPAGLLAADFVRIVPVSGGDILIEVHGTDCDVASTRLLETALEHFVYLPGGGASVKIAGVTDTVSFQMSWGRRF